MREPDDALRPTKSYGLGRTLPGLPPDSFGCDLCLGRREGARETEREKGQREIERGREGGGGRER